MTTAWDFVQRRIERHYGRAYRNGTTTIDAPVVADAVLEQR
jgi:polar amino acid transport system permease protein